jgi:hypothetical protein
VKKLESLLVILVIVVILFLHNDQRLSQLEQENNILNVKLVELSIQEYRLKAEIFATQRVISEQDKLYGDKLKWFITNREWIKLELED